jgi:acyl-CoA reductase-like NAD-dependent aldehyde dehydrogenase
METMPRNDASAIPENVELQPGTLAFLQDGPKKLFIDNEWVPAADGSTFPTINPANGRVLTEVALAGAADVERAVTAARAAFSSGPWAEMTGPDRGDLLWRISELLERYADELAELEVLDNGMNYRVARKGNLPLMIRHFRYYAGWASKLEGSTIPVSAPHTFVYTLREPMGVVGLIIPWNFPMLMATWKLAPALACGNTTILKPAEQTPLTALRMAEIIREAGAPPGVVNVLTGPGVPTGSAIVSHNDVDKIAFTGSTEVGRQIMAGAAQSNLKRVSLELGGKSPDVIFADADLSKAVKGAMWAVFSNAGQECIAGSRLFVERTIYEQVLEELSIQAQRIRVGPGFTPKIHIGPLISQEQLERVTGFIQRGQQAGAQVLVGGQRLGGELADGYFLAPTVVSVDNDELELVREEIFGPVAAVTPFDDWDELIARANRTRYGLASGVWTQDISKAHRFAHAVQAGTVYINRYGLFDPAVPFGGYKQSGFGREMGKEALDLYTQTKSVWVGL